MSEHGTDRDAGHEATERPPERVRYPENHVVGVVATPEEVASAVTALKDGGFLESEIHVVHGRAAADALHASTGLTGLTNLVIRVAERLGVADDQMAVKDRYEQALRDGQFVVMVLAPTEERRDRAAQVLGDRGGHFINFLGRFSIEVLQR